MSNGVEDSTSKTKQEDVVIDVDAWEKSMKKKLEEYTKEPPVDEEPIPTIYRVPERLRWGVNDPYEPQVISIGPYHRGKPTLEAMEKDKWQCLRRVLSRDKKHQLQHYIRAIKKLEVRARSCYSGKNEMNSKDFVEMMLLDGCFIVQILRKEYPMCHLNLALLVGFDMLLLENQIPFFILKCICELSITDDRDETPIIDLAKRFCSDMLLLGTINMEKEMEISHLDYVHHLLHMFHAFHTFTPQLNQDKTHLQNKLVRFKSKFIDPLSSVLVCFTDHFLVRFLRRQTLPATKRTASFDMIPSAIELHNAGVKFKKKREWHSLLEVTFKDGVIEIPPLLISNPSEPEFRNLIAFEQLYPYAGTQFSEYAMFMDDIINTSNDVALLHKNDIIQYMGGGSEVVANLFNNMNKGVILGRGDFKPMYENVNTYCKQKRHKWRASLMRNYFNNPLSAISLVAAAILLVLTIIQTYFSGYSVYHSHC